MPQALSPAHGAEPTAVMERDARDVLGEDPSLQRPDSVRLSPRCECGQQRTADARAARRLGDVDADLGNAAVRTAVRHRGERGPSDDASVVVDRDQPVTGEVAGVERLPGGTASLERGDAGGQARVVDPGDRRPVVVPHLLDL